MAVPSYAAAEDERIRSNSGRGGELGDVTSWTAVSGGGWHGIDPFDGTMAGGWGEPPAMLNADGDPIHSTDGPEAQLPANWENASVGRWDVDGRELDADGDVIIRTPLPDHPEVLAWSMGQLSLDWDEASSNANNSEELLEAARWGDVTLTAAVPQPDILAQVEIHVGGQSTIRDEDVVSIPFPTTLEEAGAWRSGAPMSLYLVNLPREEQDRFNALVAVLGYFGGPYAVQVRPAMAAQWDRFAARVLEIAGSEGRSGGGLSVQTLLEWVRRELPEEAHSGTSSFRPPPSHVGDEHSETQLNGHASYYSDSDNATDL